MKLKKSGLTLKAVPCKEEKKLKELGKMSGEEEKKLKESGKMSGEVKKKPLLEIKLEEKPMWWLPCLKETIVEIPCFRIYDEFEILIRNMIALEQFLYPDDMYLYYADTLNYLMDTTKDVDLFATEDNIANCVGDHEKVAKMFNGITTWITLSPQNCYFEIADKMKLHYKNGWNHLKAKLKSVYFPNLWTGTATLAAIALIILTFIQTVCSILQVLPQA